MMFQSVLDTIPVRVFWKDRAGYYLGCNQLFAEDAGKESPADLVGLDDFAIFPQDAKLYRADDAEVMQSGQAKIDYEEPQAQASGADIWLQTSKIPIRGPDQEVTGVLGTYADITPRKQAEAHREELLVELGRKNAELERFTYTVSHDLKSPLVTIQGFLGVLREELDLLDLDADNLEATGFAMHRIEEAGHHMMALLQDLLEMSRAGRTLGPRSPHDLGDLVREALAQCHGPLQEAGASPVVEGPFPVAHVDGSRIVQVLQNLIENACKYRSPDRPLKLTVHAEGEVVVVTDNGIGIPAPHRARVFELFEKLDPSTPGNGIGLALVRRLVEAHGGQIHVTPGPEAIGTRFHIHLPPVPASR
jgi:PAS domain S-box-containing protein